MTTEPNNTTLAAPAGFRLEYVEVRNWGVFNSNGHYVMNAGSRGTCLTGLNGSGKSTMIDAILTLLVPHELRHYNVAASGAEAKRERTIKTYIRGAYAKKESDESTHGEAMYLRDPGVISVLLATFKDATFQRCVTLAQLHWITPSGDHQGRYLIKEGAFHVGDLGISNLTPSGFSSHFKKHEWFYSERFADYQGKFMHLLRIPSEQALKLFCRTVSVKEVPSVTEFIRSLMLESYDTAKELDGIITHFKDLDHIHTQIVETKSDIAFLEPVAALYGSYTATNKKAEDLRVLLRAADVILASEASGLVDAAIREIDEKIAGHNGEASRLQEVIEQLELKSRAIAVSIAQNKTNAACETVRKQIDLLGVELKNARTLRENLKSWLKALGRPPEVESTDSFAKLRAWAVNEKDSQSTQQERLIALSGVKSAAATATRQRAKDISEEIDKMIQRGNNIPSVYADARDRICEDLQIPREQLPFAGELLDVPESESRWRHSIEWRVRGFALTVLVPEKHYPRVNAYVDRSEFRKRFDYDVAPAGGEISSNLDRRLISGKIVIKNDAWCKGYLQRELLNRFPDVCAENAEEMRTIESRAITDGRHSKAWSRHSKEGIESSRDYNYLGWDNHAKVEMLGKDVSRLITEAKGLDAEEKKLIEEARSTKGGITLLDNITKILTYRSIDVLGIEAELTTETNRLEELESSDEELKTLQSLLREHDTEKKNVGALRQRETDAKAVLESQKKTLQSTRDKYGQKVNQAAVDDFDWKSHRHGLEPYRNGKPLPSEGLDTAIFGILNAIKSDYNATDRELVSIKERMVAAQKRFLEASASRGYNNEFLATPEHAEGMVKLLEKLQNERFAVLKEQFHAHMDKVLHEHASVENGDGLTKQKDNKDRIEELNQTLKTIPYNRGTHVQIVLRPSKDVAVLRYRALLKDCTENTFVMTDEQRFARFGKIKLLVDFIREHRAEAEKGANPNNWDIYAVGEYRDTDPTTSINWHPDSGGNSGGQKAKLACTILAAAMAFQLRHTRSLTSNAFRLIMVDEIFAKSDDVNSAYALDVFSRFDFQLLLVTPRDGRLKLVQPYVGSFHLAQNPSGDSASLVSVTGADIDAWEKSSDGASAA